jgi:D-xylose transport system substrate-binding protein
MVFFCSVAAGILYPSHIQAQAGEKQVVIGMLFDFLRERWLKDKDAVVKAASSQGATLLVKSAESNDYLQVVQARQLMDQGAKVLLVVPHNLKRAGEIVNIAHGKKVEVVAYDRLIRDCDLDFYVSFDNQKVGELEAEYALSKVPSGNYVLIGGSPNDYNAVMIHTGWMKVLKPAVDSGKIKIAVDKYTEEWKPANAAMTMTSALKSLDNSISVVLAGNDNLAAAAINIMEGQGLAGKVLVVAQDAELDALRKIAAGKQAMTIYKPIQKLADASVELAVKLARGEKVNYLVTKTVNNGFKDVPAILLQPIVVDKNNIDKTIIQDGFYTKEQVYGR